MMQQLNSLLEVADHYDLFIFDAWGVLHNGLCVHRGARELLSQLKSMDKTVVILSNTPQRSSLAMAQLSERGLSPASYDRFMTAGEYLYQQFASMTQDYLRDLDKQYFYLGDTKYAHLIDDFDFISTSSLNEAHFILLTGYPIDNDFKINDCLLQAVALDLPMLCANPDLCVMHDGVLKLCAGSIAAQYEALGGCVYAMGKPAPDIFIEAIKGADVAYDRILMIGDSLATDIKGAKSLSLHACMVTSGIHQSDDLENVLARSSVLPDYLIHLAL